MIASTELKAMELLLYGISHQTASLKEREPFAVRENWEAAVAELQEHPRVREAACLVTCNRTEFYLLGEELEASFFSQLLEKVFLRESSERAGAKGGEKFFSLRGREAVEHLFAVASGADSLIVGEPQILSQVKELLTRLIEEKDKPVLTRLFHQAVHVGKRCRHETSIGRGNLSVPQAALTLARNIFGDLSQASVLLMGAGEMGRLTASCFQSAPVRTLFVSSRSRERGEELAHALKTQVIPFEERLVQLRTIDILITCTGASQTILTKAQLERIRRQRKGEPLFVLDLAVPRDVEEAVGSLENIYLYNIDDLREIAEGEKRKREGEVGRAGLIASQEAAFFFQWFQALKVKPAIVQLQALGEQIVQEQLEKHQALLASLSKEQQREVEKLAAQTARKILHAPLVEIKNLAQDPYQEALYLDLLQKLFRTGL